MGGWIPFPTIVIRLPNWYQRRNSMSSKKSWILNIVGTCLVAFLIILILLMLAGIGVGSHRNPMLETKGKLWALGNATKEYYFEYGVFPTNIEMLLGVNPHSIKFFESENPRLDGWGKPFVWEVNPQYVKILSFGEGSRGVAITANQLRGEMTIFPLPVENGMNGVVLRLPPKKD